MLGRAVASIWYARGTVPYTREKIAPTGSTVAVIVLGDAILQTSRNGAGSSFRADRGFIVGPHDGPVINEPTGETYAVGIVAAPVGCETVFGIRPATIRGVVCDLEAVWPQARELRDCLLMRTEPEDLLDVVEESLAQHLQPEIAGFERCREAVALLEADPVRPIGDIADQLGLSHGHLDAEFTRVVGLPPRSLARLLRLRALLEQLDVSGDVRWGDLAVEYGWFDQAHLIRDFRRHTGVTPTEYVRAQRSILTPVEPGDAAGFVPET